MSDVNVNELLAQMRVLAAQAKGVQLQPVADNGGSEFARMLKNSVDQVNSAQQNARRLAEAFEMGDQRVDRPRHGRLVNDRTQSAGKALGRRHRIRRCG